MKNKEDIYRSELFNLFKDDLGNITTDETVFMLLSEMFKSDEIDNEDLIKKLTEK